MDRRTIELPGRRTSYLIQDGSGMPLVFVHGATCAASGWIDVLDELRGRFCLAIDLPGHGESSWQGHYGFDDDAIALIGFLEAQTGPALVGRAFTRGEAARRAALTRPDLVLGLYLEDVSPFFLETGNAVNFPIIRTDFKLPSLVRRLQREGLPLDWPVKNSCDFLTMPTALWPGHCRTRRSWNGPSRPLTLIPVNPGTRATSGCRAHRQSNSWHRFEAHSTWRTATSLTGSIVTDEELARVSASSAGFTSTRFAGIGHLVHAEDPTGFVEDLSLFLERNNW